MSGGTPKKTAQVEEPRLRPRKRPGHSKVSGEATGTRLCATQALSEVSLRSSTEAKVLPPFTCHSLRVPYPWWGEDTRCCESVGKLLRVSTVSYVCRSMNPRCST